MNACDPAALTRTVKALVLENGCHLVGIATAEPFPDFPVQESPRRDPRRTLPTARAIVVGATCYLERLAPPSTAAAVGRVARAYAAGHEFPLTTEFEPAVDFLRQLGYAALVSGERECDATIPLKLAAARAGLGVIGKHSVLITRRFASWVSLGGFITDAPLEPDEPMAWRVCGRCTKCLSACPTGAIVAPFRVDRSRCLEDVLARPGPLAAAIKERLGRRVLGCETCLEACPHGQGALERVRPAGSTPFVFDAAGLARLPRSTYEKFAAGLRCDVPYEAFLRNAIVALGEALSSGATQMAETFIDHEDEGVRDAARWAVTRAQRRQQRSP